MDRQVNLPKGFAHVEFERHEDAVKAIDYMNGAQIDGNVIRCARGMLECWLLGVVKRDTADSRVGYRQEEKAIDDV